MEFNMQLIQSLFFYGIAGIAVLSALGAVFALRIVYSAVSLVVTFLSVAGIFILLNADFVGMAQVMVYAVGITIILLFAIMLTGETSDKKLWVAFKPRTLFAFGFAFLFFVMVTGCVTNGFKNSAENAKIFATKAPTETVIKQIQTKGTTAIIGEGLFTKYVLPFEVVSLLLLAVILGTAALAKKDETPAKEDV